MGWDDGSNRRLRTCWLVWIVWAGNVAEVKVGFRVSGAGTSDDLPEERGLWALDVSDAALGGMFIGAGFVWVRWLTMFFVCVRWLRLLVCREGVI